MKKTMTAVVTAQVALFALTTGVAFASEPAKKEAAPAKPAASAPAKAAATTAASAPTKAAAKPTEKKEKKGGC